LDGDTGEVFERRLTPDYPEILDWLRSLPVRLAVAYEAGPTGFGLARFLVAAGVMCLVAAPSKLQRPTGDRVKTDARDAAHLARLLHLGQIVEVSVPSAEQEAAKDLVRAREDCRRDLMSARHRLSKLLLRQGVIYSGEGLGPASTNCGCSGSGLTHRRCSSPTMLATVDRRNRLDEAIAKLAADSAYTPVVTRLGCLRGVSTLTVFGLAVEIGDWGGAGRAANRPTGACTSAGVASMPVTSARWSPTPRSPANWRAGAGHWRSSTAKPAPSTSVRIEPGGGSALE